MQFGRFLIKFPFPKPLNNQKMWPVGPRCSGDGAWGSTGLLRSRGRGGALLQSLEDSSLSPSPPHSKLLHKRDNDKVDAQEENFLPKYQRVKDLCQRAEYQTACEQLGQVRKCGRCPAASCPPSPPRAVPSPGLPLGLAVCRPSRPGNSDGGGQPARAHGVTLARLRKGLLPQLPFDHDPIREAPWGWGGGAWGFSPRQPSQPPSPGRRQLPCGVRSLRYPGSSIEFTLRSLFVLAFQSEEK